MNCLVAVQLLICLFGINIYKIHIKKESIIMKKELNDSQLEQVVGGTVVISSNYMRVGFINLTL